MCGRFHLTADPAELRELFGLDETPPALPPRYNISPTQTVAAVRHGRTRHELCWLRWGLIPAWAKDPTIGHRLINARAETAAAKPAFRAAFRSRRCLIPASGFYEWQRRDGGRRPFNVHRRDGRLMALAGLWERWNGAEGPVETCTILTRAANAVVAPLHDRMPVVLGPDAFAAWLQGEPDSGAALQALRTPSPDDALQADPISTHVNSVAHDDPACLAPAAEQTSLL